MRAAFQFLGFSLGLAALACGSSSTSTTTITRPRLVAVSPEDFLGDLGCGEDPGQVQSYVATLFDVTPLASGAAPDPGYQLPSSPPTSCSLPATFSFVVAGHRYLAQVDGYDQPPLGQPTHGGNHRPAALEPVAPGARLQRDSSSGERVSPRWVATCSAYPPSATMDGGSYVSFGGASSVTEDAAGAAGENGSLNGVVSYEGLTQTPHDCGSGLRPVAD